MDKEIKYNRKDRREILKLNKKFDSLLDRYTHEKALKGQTDGVDALVTDLNDEWKSFVINHNNNKKNHIQADMGSFIKQVDEITANDVKLAEAKRAADEKARYDRWVAKCTLKYPNLMRRWNLIGKIKKDYVKKKYEQLEGKSPRDC